MTERIEHITVVGGGTAGWLTAMVIDRFLNKLGDGPPIRISVIESPRIPTVGVGESTVFSMSLLLRQLGVDEAEFFRRCNASFKLSVRLEDWSRDAAGQPKSYYHPFNIPKFLGGFLPAYHYNKFGPAPGASTLADSMVVNSSLVEANRGPRGLGGENFDAAIGYSYHLDAALFGQFLRDMALERGVELISDDVAEVSLDERGFVSALRLAERGTFPVEFVVDCTGFKSLILQQAMGEPFESFSDQLLCDRAIPLQLPHRDPTYLEPCTRATALGAGWVWRVPLYSRLGTGYVFSSRFRSDEEAAAEFFQHLRDSGDLPAGAPDPEARVIPMKIGRVRRAWVNNCVALGLAGGFVEPLEATAIYSVEVAARWLVGFLPDRQFDPALATRFNKLMANLFDEVRDFIVSHYYTSNRPEPFWLAAREESVLSDALRENLELWRHVLPDMTDTPGSQLFNYWNYLYCLWPKDFFSGKHFPLEGSVSREAWDRHCQRLTEERDKLLATLPDHYQLLTDIRGEVPQPEPAFTLPESLQRRMQSRATVPVPGS